MHRRVFITSRDPMADDTESGPTVKRARDQAIVTEVTEHNVTTVIDGLIARADAITAWRTDLDRGLFDSHFKEDAIQKDMKPKIIRAYRGTIVVGSTARSATFADMAFAVATAVDSRLFGTDITISNPTRAMELHF